MNQGTIVSLILLGVGVLAMAWAVYTSRGTWEPSNIKPHTKHDRECGCDTNKEDTNSAD